MEGINMNANIDYNEDTEFNEALRKHGIIPPKEEEKRDEPVYEGPKPLEFEQIIESLMANGDLKDDQVPRRILEEYMEKRMHEAKQRRDNARFGSVVELSSKADYRREITEASKVPAPAGDDPDAGTNVICLMYQPYLESCKIIVPYFDALAKKYPATKFVKVVATRAVENYPDRNCPTLLCYRAGQVVGNIVGLESKTKSGAPIALGDVETLLYTFKAIDPLAAAIEQPKREKKDDSDDSESEEEEQEVAQKKKSSIFRRTQKPADSDSDSDFDL